MMFSKFPVFLFFLLWMGTGVGAQWGVHAFTSVEGLELGDTRNLHVEDLTRSIPKINNEKHTKENRKSRKSVTVS